MTFLYHVSPVLCASQYVQCTVGHGRNELCLASQSTVGEHRPLRVSNYKPLKFLKYMCLTLGFKEST